MKTKHLSPFKNGRNSSHERNIFQRTQKHLTIGFIGQLMLFLLLFILMMVTMLYTVVIQNQKLEIRELVNQEARMVEKYYIKNELGPIEYHERERELVLPGIDQFFYYVISPSGELLAGHENLPSLQSEILKTLRDEKNQEKDIFQKKLKINDNEEIQAIENKYVVEKEQRLNISQNQVHLIIAKADVSTRDHVIGTLYIGKDISFLYQLLTWLFVILFFLMVVFFGVALYVSSKMSKKAMIPIRNAFDRQREFVADASHELRTPLSVLLSSIDAVEMTVDTKEDDYVHKLLFNMKDEVKRMTNLVSDLLTLARSDSGKIERSNDLFDFTPVVKKVINSLEPFAKEKDIPLQYDVPESIVGYGDQQRLTQLLYILLDNALKYTPNKGKVQLSLSPKQGELWIEVQDTGIGIPPEEQQLIFERFYRADKARTREIGSYGLGLSIAKWIVDIHQGSIQVNSEVGKGSTFIVKIPFHR